MWKLGPKACDLLVAGRDRDSLAQWLAVHVGEPGSSECDLPVAGRDRDSLAPLPCSARVGSLGRRPATCLCGSCCWTVDLTCQVEAKPEPRAYCTAGNCRLRNRPGVPTTGLRLDDWRETAAGRPVHTVADERLERPQADYGSAAGAPGLAP